MPFLGARNLVRWKPVREPYWADMIGVVAGNIGPHVGA